MALASKKEEDNVVSAYYNDKSTVIQEARVFNESPVSPRKCRSLLTRIVYLLYVGETFGTQEATTLFFGTTKLFQHKDVSASCPAMSRRLAHGGIWVSERTATNGVSSDQGALDDGGGRDNGDQ